MKATNALFTLLVFAFPTPPYAQEAQVEHRLGQHPAVLVQRQQATQGYDYQAKFYPHPAWLYLASEAPHEMGDHPAVLIARRNALATQQAQQAQQAEPPVTVVSRQPVADASVH